MKPKDVLQPCPFCGGDAQVNTWTMHGITESRCFCPNSDCPNSVRTVALEQWNTRPIEDALTARIAELECAIRADDERLVEAGLKVGLYFGCDTAEIMADVILSSRARIAELEAEVTKSHELQDSYCDRIENLEAARRWIPVGERLPETGNLVIGITDYCGYVFFEIVDDDGQGIVLHPYRRCQGKVTHWMPLPQPPEVK